MRERATSVNTTCIVVLGTILSAGPLLAQSDSSTLHATLRGWAERSWLLLEDREAVEGGRLSDAGMLQRFHPYIDAEYELDLISSRFGLSDEYAWHQESSGARYWAGSIDHLRLVSGGDIKANVDLGSGWSASVALHREDLPPLERNLLRIRFDREWQSGVFAFLEGSLHSTKPNDDVTIGAGWKSAATEATVAVSLLDAFNDFIYQTLVVWHGFADTALDYEQQPFALRASLKTSLGRQLRLEGHGAVVTPTQVRAYLQLFPDSGFRQEERFGLVGGLLEWSAASNLRTGAFATYVRAATDRTPLELRRELDDYRLVERTTRAGAFVLARMARRWTFEGWVAKSWRPERRTYRTAAAPDVDYEDRAWSGQGTIGYGALRGFTTHAAFEFDMRDVIRGDGQVPRRVSQGKHNMRLRLDAGWRFGRRAYFLLGYRIDLDGDPRGWYDGAHGRFVFHW